MLLLFARLGGHLTAQVAVADALHQIHRVGRLAAQALDQVARDDGGHDHRCHHRHQRQDDDQLARGLVRVLRRLGTIIH